MKWAKQLINNKYIDIKVYTYNKSSGRCIGKRQLLRGTIPSPWTRMAAGCRCDDEEIWIDGKKNNKGERRNKERAKEWSRTDIYFIFDSPSRRVYNAEDNANFHFFFLYLFELASANVFSLSQMIILGLPFDLLSLRWYNMQWRWPSSILSVSNIYLTDGLVYVSRLFHDRDYTLVVADTAVALQPMLRDLNF